LVPLRSHALFTTVVPSKIFEAMATGIPVLMSVPEGEATRFVRTTACGVLVPPEDPQALADAIVRLKQNPHERARLRAAGLDAASQYSRDKQATLMLHVLETACRKNGAQSEKLLHVAARKRKAKRDTGTKGDDG
jgi:colanic acid biosynthesis glycosyl transferase WcaI